jgi:FKBP-type peptidyl-prolyl cis-trans isomerase (trigger factor)
MLLLRKLANIENIEVSDIDVESEISTLISSTGGESEAAMKQALNTENAKESIRSSLMNRKTMARLAEITQGGESASSPATAITEFDETEIEQETGPAEESSPAEEATG